MRDGQGGGGSARLIAAVAMLLSFALCGSAAAERAGKRGPPAPTKMRLVTFQNSPFPFDGEIPEKGVRFLDVVEGERRGHTTRHGTVYWQDKTYSDRRVLLALPRGFDLAKPVRLVVFFHGNGAKLERDVHLRQQVARQVLDSAPNTVLVAPQFAVDAFDSSPGRFWQPGAFRAFLDEAADELAHLSGHDKLKPVFERAPVVLVAYSGGYLPAAYALQVGDVDDRVQGVILLDALYGDTEKFNAWMVRKPDAFLIALYTEFTAGWHQAMQKQMREDNLTYVTSLPHKIVPGTVSFVAIPPKKLAENAEQKDKDKAARDLHMDFVTKSFASDPLRLILARIPRATEAAPAPPVAAAAHDPNYVARIPKPRPSIVRPESKTEAKTEGPPPRLPTARED